MTIDEAIKKYNKLANNEQTCYPEEAQQLAEWLEELKMYKEVGTVEGYKSAIECYNEEYTIRKSNKQYNKAIDDFVKEICKMFVISESSGKYRFYAVEIKQTIADLAEQLKVGAENEQIQSRE